MGRLRTYQTNFRRGRIGNGLLARTDTNAYQAALKEAKNMMVLNDGRIVRRWGTEFKIDLAEEARIESWEYATGLTTSFIMVFTNGQVAIYDSNLLLKATLTDPECAWTGQTKWFMTMTRYRNQFIVCDSTFKPCIIEYDAELDSFSARPFVFEGKSDGTEVYQPYVNFAGDIEVEATIFTTPGAALGYGDHIATASGNLASTFDLAAGTGSLYTTVDFFSADNVGQRLLILGGEVEVTAYVNAQEVEVIVRRNLAKRLDPAPFLFSKGSKIVKVFAFEHGLKAGDQIYFTGVSDVDLTGVAYSPADVLNNAAGVAPDFTTAATVVSGTAAAYEVKRVIDADTFEVLSAGTVPTEEELGGGGSVDMYIFSGIRNGIQEPAMSDIRGWPQASAIWQRRLWLGGTEELPDAMWGSALFTIENFGLGDGSPADAVALLGVGEQARIRHFVGGYDLSVFTDSAEFYVPGSDAVAITQETARAVATTKHGCSYAVPRVFDGAAMFIDGPGHHIREFIAENKDSNYRAPPLTVATPDWMAGPRDTAVYEGSATESTPYLISVNEEDGSLLVMHSARSDDSMGFMRWEMDGANFVSVTSVNSRLFAVIEAGGNYSIVEFDTTEQGIYADNASLLTQDPAGTAWTSLHHASTNCVVHDGREILPSLTPDAGGVFATNEARTSVVIGEPMYWEIEVLPPAVNMPNGPATGKMQRIVSVDVYWDNIWDGMVEGKPIPTAIDAPAMEIPSLINEWREYRVAKWGRSPSLVISGSDPARGGIKAIALNMYV